jgi:teichuronic acid biosynthesis glycosyltransferase TuaG
MRSQVTSRSDGAPPVRHSCNRMDERVSVVMPCYNGQRFLEQAVSSVLRQSYPDFELLIVDNNSSDGSAEIIRVLATGDPRIKPLRCPTPGAASARNTGIRSASGRYIAFLDCDDWWEPQKLHVQINAMRQAGAALSWSSYRIVGADGSFRRTQIASPRIDYESHMMKRSVIGCLTAVYDSALIGKPMMPDIRMRQDYALWAKIIRTATSLGLPLVGLPQALANYRVHDEAMTRDKWLAARYQWAVYRDVERHSLGTSVRYFGGYLWNALSDRL